MTIRLVITDAVWAELEPVLRTLNHYAGSPPQLNDRMFIEAVLYQARTGIPWRDVPDDFGHWDAVYNRFRRWEARNMVLSTLAPLRSQGVGALVGRGLRCRDHGHQLTKSVPMDGPALRE